LRLLRVVHDALGLALDHLDQHFHRRLEAARHARGGGDVAARHSRKQPTTPSSTANNRESIVEHRQNRRWPSELLWFRQMRQVVNDVLARAVGPLPACVFCGCHAGLD
jgi:hypothetical protein